MFRSFNRTLTLVENLVAGVSLAFATIIAVVAVILRSGFNYIIFWSEEAIIYSIIASTFFGAVITMRENEHVNIDILPTLMRRGGKKVMALIALAVTLAYLVLVGLFTWLLVFEPFSTRTVTPALKLPLWTVELCVPVAFTLMLLRALEMLWRTWTRGVEETTAADVAMAEAEAAGVDLADLRHAQEETQAAVRAADDHTERGRP